MLRKVTALFTLIFLLTAFNAMAAPQSVMAIPTQPQSSVVTPSAPNLNARGYILMDAFSGKILAEKNADERMAPASLTKLMTMYVISDALKNGTIHLDDKVRVSEKAWQTGGSRMFIKVNDEVPVRDLLQGIVVASGNDASVAMAEYLAGTEEAFASLMNATAKQLGMNNTHFVDSNGLPNPDHYSTPRDLAILAKAIINRFPDDYKLYSEKWFTYNNIRQPNRNRLLWRFELADGLKTGHTEAAGFCLVGSAKKNDTRLISVVMGARSDSSRTEESIRLLTYGFRFFETHKLYDKTKQLASIRIWRGKEKMLDIGLNDDLYVTMPAGQFKNVHAAILVDDRIKAPITKGQQLGTLQVTLNGQTLVSQPLLAMSDNPKGGIWRNVVDSLNFSFNKIFSKSQEKINNG